MDYIAIPNLEGRTVIIIDPMLATGKSLVNAYEKILLKGRPKDIHFIVAVAAPVGIDYIENHIKQNFNLWMGSIDNHLNELSYIVPGLGDAGDLSFGEKL